MPTTSLVPRAAVAAAFAAAVVACSSDSHGSSGLLQLVQADANPKVVRCNGGAAPDSMAWDIHLVNTTAEDAPVVRVSSAGLIVRSSTETLVGNQIANVENLPFTPDSAILIARRGDREIRAMFPVRSLCAQPAQWKDVYLSMRVIAGNWEVGSPWITIAVR